MRGKVGVKDNIVWKIVHIKKISGMEYSPGKLGTIDDMICN